MPDLIACSYCSEDITADSDFCPHCGVLFVEAGEVFCDEHAEESAVGVCIICRKVLCIDCIVRVHGRCFCLPHRKVSVQQDWAEVFRSTEIADAELVKSVLETAGHKVQVQNFNPVGFIWDGGGDSSISRSNISKPAKVLVPIPEYLEALKAAEEWRSSVSEALPEETETDQ